MSFTPPTGQACKNCRCFDPHGADAIGLSAEMGLCQADRRHEAMANDDWCWRWHGNADVRCGGCRWYNKSECPRTLVCPDDSPLDRYTPFAEAFPCERYEEAEK